MSLPAQAVDGYPFETLHCLAIPDFNRADIENLLAMGEYYLCLLYTSPSPRDQRGSRMPSSA